MSEEEEFRRYSELDDGDGKFLDDYFSISFSKSICYDNPLMYYGY